MIARCPKCGTPENRPPGCATCAAARAALAHLYARANGTDCPRDCPTCHPAPRRNRR